MARSLTIHDDLNGQPGAQPRKFSLGEVDYEIDLTEANYDELIKLLEPYRSRSRVVTEKRRNLAPVVNPGDQDKIRAWAIANGRRVSSRGRFPNDVVRDYYATVKTGEVEYILA
jgi:hypothetical protein